MMPLCLGPPIAPHQPIYKQEEEKRPGSDEMQTVSEKAPSCAIIIKRRTYVFLA